MIRLCAALVLATAISAADTQLAGGAEAFDGTWVGGMTKSLVDAPAQGGKAVQLVVSEVPDQTWKAQTWVTPLAADIAAGDTVKITLTARCTAPAGTSGMLNVIVGMKAAPYKQIVYGKLEIGSEWKEYTVSGEAKEALAGADARFGFTAGFQVQTLEIAKISAVVVGK
jgi:hypothetical protein